MTTEEEKQIEKMRNRMMKDVFAVLLPLKDGGTPKYIETKMDEMLGYNYAGQYMKGGFRNFEDLLSQHEQVTRNPNGSFRAIATENTKDLADLMAREKKKKKGGKRPKTSFHHSVGMAYRKSPVFGSNSRTLRSFYPANGLLNTSRGGGFATSSPSANFGYPTYRRPPSSFAVYNARRPATAQFTRPSSSFSFGTNTNTNVVHARPTPASSSTAIAQSSVTQIEPDKKHSNLPSIAVFCENVKKMFAKVYPARVHLSGVSEMYENEYKVYVNPLELFSKSWNMLAKTTLKSELVVVNEEIGLSEEYAKKAVNRSIPPPITSKPETTIVKESPNFRKQVLNVDLEEQTAQQPVSVSRLTGRLSRMEVASPTNNQLSPDSVSFSGSMFGGKSTQKAIWNDVHNDKPPGPRTSKKFGSSANPSAAPVSASEKSKMYLARLNNALNDKPPGLKSSTKFGCSKNSSATPVSASEETKAYLAKLKAKALLNDALNDKPPGLSGKSKICGTPERTPFGSVHIQNSLRRSQTVAETSKLQDDSNPRSSSPVNLNTSVAIGRRAGRASCQDGGARMAQNALRSAFASTLRQRDTMSAMSTRKEAAAPSREQNGLVLPDMVELEEEVFVSDNVKRSYYVSSRETPTAFKSMKTATADAPKYPNFGSSSSSVQFGRQFLPSSSLNVPVPAKRAQTIEQRFGVNEKRAETREKCITFESDQIHKDVHLASNAPINESNDSW